MRFNGRTAVVTGAASGIGKATALRLAAEGARVIAADIDAQGSEAMSRQSEGRIVFKRTDVCADGEIRELMDFAARHSGGIDILFNNAGAAGAREKIDEIDADGWDRTMNLLLRSVAMGIRHAVPHMVARGGGSIVNTASVAALSAGMGPTAYSVAKAGVLHLTKLAAADLARHRIRVNAICPGFIKTNIFATSMEVPAALRDRVNGMIAGYAEQAQPVARGGKPEDIAGTVAFLASDDAAFITGTHILVDGGILIGPRHSWDPAAPKMFDAIRQLIDSTAA
jgi:NAD(P)-dependent dehydrogenase (short-subunit alcohol dehydrogenase family)